MNPEINDHFAGQLGNPVGTYSQTDVCEVIAWENPEDRAVTAMTTAGMSRTAQFLPEGVGCPSKEPRTELMMYCSVGQENIVGGLLGDAAAYPFQHQTHLHWWHTLMLGKPIIPGSELCGLLFSLPPIPDPEFSTFWISGKRVDILWVIPITLSESEFAAATSIQALERELEANAVDVTNFKRLPIA